MPAKSAFDGVFRVGVTPDFYTEAKGRFENILEHKLTGLPGLDWQPMPPQTGNVATSEALNEFDAIFSLALKYTAESVREVDRLALVSRWGVGYDMIDVDALSASDIALAITPAAVRRPVAEAIFTFIFALTTNLRLQDRLVREEKWRGDLPKARPQHQRARTWSRWAAATSLARCFKWRARWDLDEIASDPFVTREQAAAAGAKLVEVDELLAESDFLTINTLLNSKTRGFIGEKELRQMKPGAYLINTARGPIVQEAALVRALKENWIAGAGLDVFEQEPLPQSSPLRELDNVILSPTRACLDGRNRARQRNRSVQQHPRYCQG